MIDRFTGKYAFLSNFYPCMIVYNQIPYQTVEHAYQAQKASTEEERIPFQYPSALTPGQAKRQGKKFPLNANWKKHRIVVMTDLIDLKFNIPELREKLLDTGTEELIEGNDWNDTFWGVCNGVGQNYLGRILMNKRSSLRAEEFYV